MNPPADSSRPGPMVWAHRGFITIATIGAAFFTLWSARATSAAPDPAGAAMTLASLAVTIALAIYLRSLRGLAAKLTPRSPGR